MDDVFQKDFLTFLEAHAFLLLIKMSSHPTILCEWLVTLADTFGWDVPPVDMMLMM
jgi:hypothetical protein